MELSGREGLGSSCVRWWRYGGPAPEQMTDPARKTASDDWYRLVVEVAPQGLIVVAEDGVIRLANRSAERIFGFERGELVGQPITSRVPARLPEAGAPAPSIGAIRALFGRRKDGTEVLVEVSVAALDSADGSFTVASISDLTERGHRDTALRQSHAELVGFAAQQSALLEVNRHRQQTILDALPSMVGYWDAGLINRFANAAYKSWFGVDGPSLEGRHMIELLGPELFALNRPYAEAALRGEPQAFERAIPNPGSAVPRHSLTHYLPDVVAGEVRGFHVMVHDVTELIESRRALTATLKEREVLLQEIHHRVKNNLQVITSLLNMQVRRLGEGEARDSVEECRRRVMVIALIHQQLYASHDYSHIDFGRFVRSLASGAYQSANPADGVRVHFDVDDIVLGVGLAIPFAMLVNELVTNALKHAFVGRAPGTVRVALRRDGDLLRLEVADDGVGLPAGFEMAKATSIGSQLVITLAAQLRGTLTIDRDRGTVVRVTLPLG
jgi:PAS domain S-box-containing protein